MTDPTLQKIFYGALALVSLGSLFMGLTTAGAEGLAFAESVARKSPLAVANAKRVMSVAWEQRLPLDASLPSSRTVQTCPPIQPIAFAMRSRLIGSRV